MKHGSGGRPGKGGRQITPDEAELWQRLTYSLEKVKIKPRVSAHGGDAAATPAGPASGALHPASQRPAAPAAVPASPAPPAGAAPAVQPRPSEFDRRTLRQVAGGKVAIDAKLDLHGLRQDAAYARLRAFLVSCQDNGHKLVLVVTGKGVRPLATDLRSYGKAGGKAGGEGHFQRDGQGADPVRGVLRRSVPLWLAQPELRAMVVGYAAAGPRHGGDGALYIRLRKARDA